MSRQTELMALTNSVTDKRYRFYLTNASKGQLLLRFTPEGWKDAKFHLKRNEKYMGLFRTISVNELTFVKDGRDFIRDVYEGEGINAEITFTVQRLDDTTSAYLAYFEGKIDLSTYRIEETGCKVGIIDTSLHEKVKNRENLKVDIRKRTSVNGYSIPAFADENPYLEFPDFEIQATAGWTLDLDDFDTNDDDHYCPLLLGTSEFTEAQSQTITGTDPMFLAATADRTIQIQGRLTGQVTWSAVLISPKFRIYIYANGVVVKTYLFTGTDTDTLTFDCEINESVAVTTGNDISIRGSALSYSETATIEYDTAQVSFNEPIESVPGFSYIAYPFYEATLRVLQLITDSNDCLYSEKFGRTDTPVVTYVADGQLGHISKGLFLRGANSLNNTLALSFAELFGSLNDLFCLGMGIEEKSGVDKVVIEDLSYFFDENVILDISDRIRTDAISKEVLPDWHYSIIKSGYQSFDYNDANERGTLSEFNTKSEFSTVISALDNTYDIVNKYRGDTCGIVALRAAGNTNDSEKGDENIFVIDSVRKVAAPYWTARTSEGFDIVTGGIDADQWYNLDFSPKRTLLRHGLRIRAGLERNKNTFLRFQESDKNTTLATQLSTESELLHENDNVRVNDLTEPMWWAEAYDLECEFRYDDLTAILANPKGLIKLADDKYGWILELDAGIKENKVHLKLLRANLNYITPVE